MEIVLAILGSSLITTLVNYFLFMPRHKQEVKKLSIDTHKSDTDAAKSDIELIKSEAELVEFERKLIADARQAKLDLDSERESHRLDNYYHERDTVRLKQELNDLRIRFFNLSHTIEELRISEADCRTKLIEVDASIAKMRVEQIQSTSRLKQYSDTAAQLTALVKKAHTNGFLTDDDIVGLEGND